VSPYEIKNRYEWEEYLGELAKKTGLTLALVSPDGTLLQVQGQRNQLCREIRARPEALTYVCSQSSAAMRAQVQRAGAVLLDQCEVGLWYLTVPVIREGELVALVNGCGQKPDDEDLEPFMVAQQLKVTEDQAEALSRDVPHAEGDQIEALGEKIFADLNPR
jgi:ligand-binding sensor protein